MSRLLALVLYLASPTLAQAADLSVIIGGWSHHFVPATERDELNQAQHTFGLEFSNRTWDLQALHQTDSFGCSSNDLAITRRWELFMPEQWIHGGLMLGALAAYRCKTPPEEQSEFIPILHTAGDSGYIGLTNFGPGYGADCNYDNKGEVHCTLYKAETIFLEKRDWVFGVLPGAYLTLGQALSFELTLIRSPWSGHHLVLYGQISVKVFSF